MRTCAKILGNGAGQRVQLEGCEILDEYRHSHPDILPLDIQGLLTMEGFRRQLPLTKTSNAAVSSLSVT